MPYSSRRALIAVRSLWFVEFAPGLKVVLSESIVFEGSSSLLDEVSETLPLKMSMETAVDRCVFEEILSGALGGGRFSEL